MSDLAKQIVSAVRHVVGQRDEFTLLHGPYLPPNAWAYTKECLDTGWVSSAGQFVTRFEEELADFVGCRRAVAVVNGTAALEMCFRLSGVEAGNEVICPSLTFVATANAISHCGAVPHFVDVEPSTMGLCPDALGNRLDEIGERRGGIVVNRSTGRQISAVCAMHCFGYPARLDELGQVCKTWGIPLVEDAAESLGSFYHDVHTGRRSKLSAVSFNGNKIITTGGGGAILTDDDQLADLAKHLTTTAKTSHKWEFHHDEVAWNYRMPNVNAAIGCAQLEQLPAILRAKRELHERYRAAMEPIDGVDLLSDPPGCSSNHWLNCLVLSVSCAGARDGVLEELNAAGLQSRPLWQPMHCLPMFKNSSAGPLEVTDSLYHRCINVPSSSYLVEGLGATVE
ncbi:MAG TPA: LegC family aminotransferase [Planctomycetaceae bacterium]|nr:LegC family aminotransferase [Planctomycetaceae bacterium]